MGIKINKIKAKSYIVVCSYCKKPIDHRDVVWLNRVPVCAYCIIKKRT